MEDPVKDIPHVIHLLTQSPPHIQHETLLTYFTPDASFTHPFCRTGSFANSRWLIWMIYRWYKILSPHIRLTVNSVAYDEKHLRLYVDISQSFHLFFVPFYHADVTLVTVLNLSFDKQRNVYLITSQNDLYQTNEFLKFVWPGGWFVAMLWQFVATALSVLGALVLWPITWLEDNVKVPIDSAVEKTLADVS